MISVNNKIIVSPYTDPKEMRGEIKGGLFLPGQKGNLVGLKVLENATICEQTNTSVIPKGSIVYVREDIASTQDMFRASFKNKNIAGGNPYAIIEYEYVIAIELGENE